MKKLLFIISILIIFQAFGQDFKWEVRMYTLQNYIQNNFIKEISIASGSDSLKAAESTERVLLFDELGRMTEMKFHFSDKIPQFKVLYSYKGNEPIYSEKIMFRRDSTGRYMKEIVGLTQYSNDPNIIKELIFSDDGDTLRKNIIHLNEENFIEFRESIIIHNRTYRTYYNYTKIGLFESSWFELKNHNQDSFIPVWNTFFQYDSLNQLENVIQLNGIDSKDTTMRVDYDIKSDSSINFNQCEKMGIIKGGTESFYFSCNQYHFNKSENGFYIITNKDKHEIFSHTYITKFEFYEKNDSMIENLNTFIYVFYSPIDVVYTF